MRWDVNVFVVRQVFLEIAVCLTLLSMGLIYSFPSILSPAILAPDSDIKVTPDQASWIVTSLGFGGILGFAIIPTVFEMFGRKMANILTNFFMLTGSVIMYVASDVYSLAFARVTQGLSMGGTYTIIAITISECVSPKRRGYFMAINKVFVGLGSLACHTLVYALNWRQIAVFGALPNLISIIIFTFSAESPSFLAMQAQFDKCAETFHWYRGDSINAKNELKELVSAQTEILRMKERQADVSTFKKIKEMLLTKEFQKSFYIVTLAALCLDTCGRHLVQAYITQIFIEVTNSTTLAMHMSVVTDCVLIFALAIATVLVKHFKRRTLLFRLGFCSVLLMFMISFAIILRSKFGFLQDMQWLVPGLLLLHTFISNVGLVPIAFTLPGEVFSLDQRGLGSFVSGITFLIFFNIVMKLTPLMIDETGVEGTYAILGVLLFVFLVLLRIILPETKDKTLQQIEDEIKGIVRNNSDIELVKFVIGDPKNKAH